MKMPFFQGIKDTFHTSRPRHEIYTIKHIYNSSNSQMEYIMYSVHVARYSKSRPPSNPTFPTVLGVLLFPLF